MNGIIPLHYIGENIRKITPLEVVTTILLCDMPLTPAVSGGGEVSSGGDTIPDHSHSWTWLLNSEHTGDRYLATIICVLGDPKYSPHARKPTNHGRRTSSRHFEENWPPTLKL